MNDRYVTLESSSITFIKAPKSFSIFCKELNAIEGVHLNGKFGEFFENWYIEDFKKGFKPKDGTSVELLYNNKTGFYSADIEDLVKALISFCETNHCLLNLVIKMVDDGFFTTYMIVKDNEIHDISRDINEYMHRKEAKMTGR
jgi:hypothetical protein